MQASKWLSHPVLMDAAEMSSLLEALGAFYIYAVSQVLVKGKELLSHKDFLATYEYYIHCLQQGRIPEESTFRPAFSSVFTVTPEPLYAMELPDGRRLIRVAKPVIQLQPNAIDYSPHDNKFRSGVYGSDSVLWGIQFSYPQLYLDPKTKQPLKVIENDFFPNTHLFHQLQRWIREYTMPTPFRMQDKTVHVPIRIGKNCLSWVNHHPQMLHKKLAVLNNI